MHRAPAHRNPDSTHVPLTRQYLTALFTGIGSTLTLVQEYIVKMNFNTLEHGVPDQNLGHGTFNIQSQAQAVPQDITAMVTSMTSFGMAWYEQVR